MSKRLPLPFARLDPITYLPNRQHFFTEYERSDFENHDLIMVGLDTAKHFGELLRVIGHECSEDFIRAGAARIREIVPIEIAVYHVSLIGFCFIYPRPVEPIVAKLIERFDEELICNGIPFVTHIGVGLASCSNPDGREVLRTALAAAQESRLTSSGWGRYEPLSDIAYKRSFLLLTQLTAAIHKPEQLNVHYQPKYNMKTGRISGAEALVRWTHPQLGVISPAEFIPLAEATALISALTKLVVERVVTQISQWQKEGLNITVSVNVSPRSFRQEDFSAYFLGVLGSNDVKPSSIELEFTEDSVGIDDTVLRRELRVLRDAGMRIALDKFGTGFSNLAYIAYLPADTIKIDKSVIQQIGINDRTPMLVKSIIDMAHGMNCTVVCQGILNAGINRMLAEWGCDEGQGVYMSHALDAKSLAEFIRSQAPAPNSLPPPARLDTKPEQAMMRNH